jgi:hypothetical protein
MVAMVLSMMVVDTSFAVTAESKHMQMGRDMAMMAAHGKAVAMGCEKMTVTDAVVVERRGMYVWTVTATCHRK